MGATVPADLTQREFSAPTYHGTVSGVLKNALDYVNDLIGEPRPFLDGRPVGCVAPYHRRADRYKKCDTVERAINRMKQSRAVATRLRQARPPRHHNRRSPHHLATNSIDRTRPGWRRCARAVVRAATIRLPCWSCLVPGPLMFQEETASAPPTRFSPPPGGIDNRPRTPPPSFH
ncbi:NADPH-dependent FMN reductase [Streptomyces buecherae]|uniref:NADPH-dependent FMN reductase n=1 Tax=Streptomyces buecherae TaxID=2763006 RepID=UPI0037941F1D